MFNDLIINTQDGCFLKVKVISNASVNSIEPEEAFIKLRINAPAVDNKANEAIIKFLSKHFEVPKKSIEITKGAKSSLKTIFIKNKNLSISDF